MVDVFTIVNRGSNIRETTQLYYGKNRNIRSRNPTVLRFVLIIECSFRLQKKKKSWGDFFIYIEDVRPFILIIGV